MTIRQRAIGFALLTLVGLGWCVGVSAAAQFGVFGRSIGQGTVAPTTTCDLVAGCVAAWNSQRTMLASYAGPLFRLRRTSDNAQTDIGQTGAGLVDMSAIATFCGTTSSSGRTTTTTNGCQFVKAYDQTGHSANDMLSVNAVPAACYTPYAVNAGGKPVFLNGPAASPACFFAATSPTGMPTGNANVTVYIEGNDALWPVEQTPYGYSFDFGLVHAISNCCPNGSSFSLDIRGGPTQMGQGFGDSDYLTFGVDEEVDVAEMVYGLADHDLTEAALTTNFATMSNVGDFVGAASYNNVSTDIEIDFQNGLRHTVINWALTATQAPFVLNIGGGTPTEIREGFTQDSTGAMGGGWYGGAIYASTLTLTQMRQLQAAGQTSLSITAPPVCSNGGINLLGGYLTVTGAWGLRQLDPTIPGPVVAIIRASDSAVKVIGTTRGNCTVDVSGVSSFCNATTCRLYDLANQVIPALSKNTGWQGRIQDPTRFTSGGSASAGPTFTLNGLNSTLPVITCGGSDVLTSTGSANAVTRPWTLAASAKRTSTGGALFQDGAGTNILYNGGANLLGVQSSSGTQTASSTDGTWHAVAGTVPDNTHITAYVNGAGSTSGSVTTGNTASSTWKLCNGFTGTLTELFLINSTDAGATALGNLSTLERAIGGF